MKITKSLALIAALMLPVAGLQAAIDKAPGQIVGTAAEVPPAGDLIPVDQRRMVRRQGGTHRIENVAVVPAHGQRSRRRSSGQASESAIVDSPRTPVGRTLCGAGGRTINQLAGE